MIPNNVRVCEYEMSQKLMDRGRTQNLKEEDSQNFTWNDSFFVTENSLFRVGYCSYGSIEY